MATRVVDNRDELRYELWLDDKRVGELRYTREDDGHLVLVHTEVDPSVEGHGLGNTLIEGALADIRERGLTMTPFCPFVRRYLERHPEAEDLVHRAN